MNINQQNIMKLYCDSPEVRQVALAAFPSYNGRKFSVQDFHGPMRLDSCWYGGSRDYWTFVDLATMRNTYQVAENGTPFSNGGQIEQCSELPANVALVRHSLFCGKDAGITVYINPANLAKFLPAPVELTRAQKIVLAATCGLKSSYSGISNYRFHKANQLTGITLQDWDQARAELITRSLLNKAGAITDAGRNAIGNLDLYQLARETAKA